VPHESGINPSNEQFASLRTYSGFRDEDQRTLDPHPTDILRLDIAIGVIDTLSSLSVVHRNIYIELLETFSKFLAAQDDTIAINGKIPVERDKMPEIAMEVPLPYMRLMAQLVGRYIATGKLTALGGHGIQEIETWDANDEAQALAVADELLRDLPPNISPDVRYLGDDAQLLAGSTIALVVKPDLYEVVTKALEKALNRSFDCDPIWGLPRYYQAAIKYVGPRPAQPAPIEEGELVAV
jgi:hypothetical protein